MSASALAPASPSWIPLALRSGVLAGLLGSTALALGYFLAHPDVPALHSWPVTVTAILVSGALSGASLGLAVCGGMAVARRRRGRAVSQVLGAAGGGVAGSLLPGAIGVLGFGSLSTPYIGTDVAAVGVLVAALLLGTLLSLPAAGGQHSQISPRAAFGCSALASVLVIVPFGVTIAGIVASELPFPVIRQILRVLRGAGGDYTFAAVALTIGLAVVFGAIFGAFIGLAGNLAALLRRSLPATPRRR